MKNQDSKSREEKKKENTDAIPIGLKCRLTELPNNSTYTGENKYLPSEIIEM